ncbi:MAG: M56 family metallopeptidase, partial [Rhodanobacter sp.]
MSIDHVVISLLARLGWTSLQAVILIGLLALLVHLLPRLSAAMRCTLWWLVGAQLLAGMVWHAPLQLRLLSPPAVERTLDAAVVSTPAPANLLVNATASVAAAPHENRAPTPASPAAPRWLAHAPLALALLWLAGLLAQLPAIVRQGWQARRLLRESTPVANASLQAQCATQAHALGLRRAPALRASAAIASPQVLGWRRPTILLPTGQALSEGDASLALIHELAHVRRGDLWLGWIPAMAQRLFFFHPLVAWAMREYALAREAACDAQVLAQPDIEPQRYGRLLLRLGVAHPLRAGLAGASPSFGNLKRRLTMLQHTPMLPRQRMQGWLLVAVIAIAGVLPYRVTAAASDQPAPPARSASTAWMAPPPPA